MERFLRDTGGIAMMRSFAFPVALRPETRRALAVRFRDLPEAISSGTSRRDAILQAADCLEEAIAGRISDALEIPLPSRPRRGEILLTLSAAMAAKAALYLAIKEAGLPNTQAAKRLGVNEKEICHMLDPRHANQLARIQRALALLGSGL
jgi:antitoxin HicB